MSHPLEWNAVIATATRLVARAYPDENYILERDYSDSTGLLKCNVGRLEDDIAVATDRSMKTVKALKTIFRVEVSIPLDPNPMFDVVKKPDEFGNIVEQKKHWAPIPNAERGGRLLADAVLAELDAREMAEAPPAPVKERRKPGPKPKAESVEAPADMGASHG